MTSQDGSLAGSIAPVGPQKSYLSPGQIIGKYSIDETISTEGRVKVVYKAHLFLEDAGGTGPVAVKVFRLPEDISNLRTRANLEALGGEIGPVFEREFRAMSRLSNNNLARFLDYGAFPYPSESDPNRHLYYFVEDYIPGKPLSKVAPFNDEQPAWTPQYFANVAYVVGQVATGLAYLHKRNMAHLDIKPANIIITNPTNPKEGRVVTTDFTHARKIFGPQLHLQGSRLYDAPEECREPPRRGTKTDIWALGVTFYQALTGKYPFETSIHDRNWQELPDDERERQEQELVRNILQPVDSPHMHVSSIPRTLEEVCLTMLSKTDSNRPRAQNIARTLLRFASR